MTLDETEIASVIKGRCPEFPEDTAIGLWLSIVVAFSIRLYPEDPAGRIAWAGTCGWNTIGRLMEARGPTPLREVLLHLHIGGTEGPADALGR